MCSRVLAEPGGSLNGLEMRRAIPDSVGHLLPKPFITGRLKAPCGVIDRTFLIFPGIGAKRERMLWRAGIHDWSSYLEAAVLPGVTPTTRNGHRGLVETAQAARQAGDWARLAALFPVNEHWRFYPELAPRVGCLDIETTGTHRGSPTTVVGVHEPATGTTHQLVRGFDLDHTHLKALLSRFDILVTFNGNAFDLPILRHQFPRAVPDVPHVDLRGPLSRLGFRGGLKRIEHGLGLRRPEEVVGIDGYEAVLLWRRHELRRDGEALAKLLAYNKEDVVSLKPLADFATAALYNAHCRYWHGRPATVRWPAGSRIEDLPPECEGIPGVDPDAESVQLALTHGS